MSSATFAISVKEVAASMGVSARTVARLCETGAIPAVQLVPRGSWRIRSDWQAYLADQHAKRAQRGAA